MQYKFCVYFSLCDLNVLSVVTTAFQFQAPSMGRRHYQALGMGGWWYEGHLIVESLRCC